ncbi:MAG: UDP-N-acetylmuramate dehydrogenase [Clostridia bacterium]|nr:UDP-N-acetylmuramate dehydrogenase [Clostridia bacterium]
MQNIYEEILKNMPNSEVKQNELMSKHTSFRIGGPADIWIRVKDIDELIYIVNYANKNNLELSIVGNGSNTLVKDKGIRGITISPCFENIDIKWEGDIAIVNAGSGVKLPVLANELLKNEIEGFEFASGIPGSVGGAVRMNAGAYGGEMKQIVESVTFINEEGNLITVRNEDINFSYRYSRFKEKKEIIVNVKFKLSKGNAKEIKEKMDDLNGKRIEKQPLNMPSGGSTFKRGNGFITSQIIDEAGLKGYKIGGAQVSEKHAGFIVNTGNATAEDVLNLVDYVIKVVYEKYGKIIEPEIEVIGE